MFCSKTVVKKCNVINVKGEKNVNKRKKGFTSLTSTLSGLEPTGKYCGNTADEVA